MHGVVLLCKMVVLLSNILFSGMKNIQILFLFSSLLFLGQTLTGQTFVTDIDGNVYPTTVIGNQEWMAENLRTSRYVNGETIVVSDGGENWANTYEGAWIVYENDETNKLLYGKLYNWYAVQDSRGICPAGWRVPADEDWQELTQYLDPETWGNNNNAGTLLKSRRQVNSPLGGEFSTAEHPRWDAHSQRYGTDEHDFAALPAGNHTVTGGFMHKGSYGYFWSATESADAFAYASVLIHTHRGMSRSAYPKNTGLSVRCIKDNEVTTYNLTLLAQPEGYGETTGAGAYVAGQPVTVSAIPAAGNVFSAWNNSQGNIVSSSAEYTFDMPAENISLVAMFEPEPPFVVTTFPWEEDFEGSVFPPSGWERYNLKGAFREWEMSSAQNHSPSGAQSAFHNYGPAFDGMQEGWLVTPEIIVPENSQLQLSFWSYNTWPAWYHKNSVLVSVASGDPRDGDFTEIWTASSVSSSWVQTVVNLQDYAGQSIFLAFRYEGQDSHSWFLDDVFVGETGDSE